MSKSDQQPAEKSNLPVTVSQAQTEHHNRHLNCWRRPDCRQPALAFSPPLQQPERQPLPRQPLPRPLPASAGEREATITAYMHHTAGKKA